MSSFRLIVYMMFAVNPERKLSEHRNEHKYRSDNMTGRLQVANCAAGF